MGDGIIHLILVKRHLRGTGFCECYVNGNGAAMRGRADQPNPMFGGEVARDSRKTHSTITTGKNHH